MIGILRAIRRKINIIRKGQVAGHVMLGEEDNGEALPLVVGFLTVIILKEILIMLNLIADFVSYVILNARALNLC